MCHCTDLPVLQGLVNFGVGVKAGKRAQQTLKSEEHRMRCRSLVCTGFLALLLQSLKCCLVAGTCRRDALHQKSSFDMPEPNQVQSNEF
jgi:hypothetical protein